ncbi:TetR/AcrR family transcriptional regulator [Streptomyces litchfieldiae]|uniref:Helix-turn-helix domain-containing protein n=1 Tax=Streptomyces litchfieldiae TaxID=3075543 RepID=A0ABU2MP32_9ACTN|nr:helix-turn-helix domain-containing protein [Streptomyces sp. DSM 44938]MDT0343385.1 helix-turn-helix domain-containing protein [Streptomyces sp. DSM 44938]
MNSTRRPRRSDTRQRIQDVALELFAEQGYDKTSLREIAERLGVTKAALYYHFRTKEDILIGLYEDLTRPMDELIAWAREQPATLETKKEILRRYGDQLRDSAPMFRFFQENQAALRELTIGVDVKARMVTMGELMQGENPSLADRMRCLSALFIMHAGVFSLRHVEADPEDKRRAALEVAIELVAAAHTEPPH